MKEEIAKEIVDELRLIREELQNLTMPLGPRLAIPQTPTLASLASPDDGGLVCTL